MACLLTGGNVASPLAANSEDYGLDLPLSLSHSLCFTSLGCCSTEKALNEYLLAFQEAPVGVLQLFSYRNSNAMLQLCWHMTWGQRSGLQHSSTLLLLLRQRAKQCWNALR